MSDGLKPCPFCGGEAKMHAAFAHGAASRVGAYVECVSCGAWSKTHWGDGAQEKTAEAWNRRAERTCRPEVCDDGAGAWGVYCSECCYRFVGPYGSRDLPERMAARRDIMPHYCSSCGAKVVE